MNVKIKTDYKMNDIKKVGLTGSTIKETKSTQIKLVIKRILTTDLKSCHEICLSPEVIWLAENGSDHNIQRIHKLVKNILPNILAYEMKPLPNGDLLIADRSPTLKIVNNNNGEIMSSKFTAKSLIITAVHLTNEQDVIVGARSTELAWPIQGRRVVMVFNWDGKVKEEWEYDDNGERIILNPRIIDQARNNNIFIFDCLTEDWKGRVVVLSPRGKVINTYTGHPSINNDDDYFNPTTIRNTPSDNMAVIDSDPKFIHLLDNTGNFLSYFDTTSIFQDFPYCMAFSDGKTAYIGCTTETDSEENAKLYELEYSEY